MTGCEPGVFEDPTRARGDGRGIGCGPRSGTVTTLPQIIIELRAKGYPFVSISGTGPIYGPQVSAI